MFIWFKHMSCYINYKCFTSRAWYWVFLIIWLTNIRSPLLDWNSHASILVPWYIPRHRYHSPPLNVLTERDDIQGGSLRKCKEFAYHCAAIMVWQWVTVKAVCLATYPCTPWIGHLGKYMYTLCTWGYRHSWRLLPFQKQVRYISKCCASRLESSPQHQTVVILSSWPS